MSSFQQPASRWMSWRLIQWLCAALVSLLLFGGAALVAGRRLAPAFQGAGAGLVASAASPESRASSPALEPAEA